MQGMAARGLPERACNYSTAPLFFPSHHTMRCMQAGAVHMCTRWAHTVVALVLVHRLGVVLRRLGVPVVALSGVLRLAVVALVLVHRLGVVLRRLGVPVVALVLVLQRLGVPVVALGGVLGLAVVALVLVLRLRVMLRRLGVPVVALGVVLGLACGEKKECQMALGTLLF